MDDNKNARFLNYVDGLPPELIQEILVLGLRATRTPRSRVKYLKAISSVSKFWRSSALAEAQLWSMVSIVLGNAVGTLRGVVLRGVEAGERNVALGSDEAELKRAAMWLRMSRNAPLHIALDFLRYAHGGTALCEGTHLHRCRTLRLRLSPEYGCLSLTRASLSKTSIFIYVSDLLTVAKPSTSAYPSLCAV